MSKRRGVDAWRAVVEGFGGSGLTVPAYCAREGTCTASFYRWRSVLSPSSIQRLSRNHPRNTPPATSPASRPPAAFVDLGSLRERGRVELRLDLGDGLMLQVSRG